MRKKEFLFVTYYVENLCEEFPYAFNLAKIVNEGVTILFIYKKKITKNFENLMTAITFAGTNALKAVRQVVEKVYVEDEKTVFLMKKINRKGISVDIYAEKADLWLAIKIFLGQRTAIYIVLLSLNMSNSEHLKVRELSRIVKITSRTLIKMVRQA